MMYPKPKSAPPRIVQSKFVKNKTNAMKEIEAWVKKDDDPLSSHEASRMSGQLTDNVTEERMLRSKLWELSKERYKFLAQNAYEKKMFQDRIQRKSSALLRRASSSSTVDRQPEGEGVSRAKQRWKNARLALLDRLDPTKHKDKVDGKQAKEGKPDHILQTCPHLEQLRREIWPIDTSLRDKRWGNSDDLQKTEQFIAVSGLRI
nr:hypothetical protein BaRGS_003248 [Batillaria attramentaria]